MRKFKDEKAFYEVALSPKGFTILRDYMKTFPEIVEYMRSNLPKWGKKFEIPRAHKIRSIYPNEDSESDLNIKLFKIYQWIMVSDISTLNLTSALSLVPSYNL